MSTLSIIDAPMTPHGFVAKAGALAAGTALAGAALFGGTAVAPTVATGFAASVQHDVTLNAFPTFTDSLQSLLDTLGFGTMGNVLGLFGPDITTASDLSALLTALNPDNTSLDAVTGSLFSTDITALLDGVQMGGTSLGDAPIDTLIGSFIGGAGANMQIGDLLDVFGLGQYAGLLDLPFAGLSPTDTVAELLNSMLGISGTTSINDLLDANGMGGTSIGDLLGITPSLGWDDVISGLTLGGTLTTPGTEVLGDMSLADLLGSLMGSPVTDATTLTDFLSGLDLFAMLGLS